MSNHFHLLVEEPDRETVQSLDAETILRRIGFLYDMTMSEAIRHRVRYMTEGAVFGSEQFVNRVFERNRSHFGKTRQTGARAMREANWENLCVLRDLREEILVPTQATLDR